MPSWSQEAIPNFVATEELFGISCTSSSACVAVGATTDLTIRHLTRAFHWNGSLWDPRLPPQPGIYSEFRDVSCTASNACTGVGIYMASGGGAILPFAGRWNGTAWALQSVPLPGGATTATLSDVACTNATTCTAVGTSTMTYVVVWNRTSWTVQPSANPGGATAAALGSVSCTASNACTAVGRATISGAFQPLIERWDGSTWTIQTSTLPATGNAGEFNGVSCTSATACSAAGYFRDATTSSKHTYVSRWNGTSWTHQPTPDPGNVGTAQFFDISCGSATACRAVGDSVDLASVNRTLAASWNGVGWELDSTVDAGTTGNRLNGLSCVGSTCRAAGIQNNGGSIGNLIERYP